MADNLDKLLFSLGAQADGEVPYADALEKIKAKTELERARRRKRDRAIRLVSIAASFVIVLGVGTVLLTKGFFASGKAADPEAASTDVTAACCEPAADIAPMAPMAPAPAALYDAPNGGAALNESAAPEATEPPMLGMMAPGTDDECGALSGGAGTDGDMRVSGAPEAMIFTIGLPKALPSPTDAAIQGNSAKAYSLELTVLPDAPCEIGEAAIYQLDEITISAQWRIAENDYISISASNMSVEELVLLMEGMAE